MREGMTDIFDDYHFCDWFTNLKVRRKKVIRSKKNKYFGCDFYTFDNLN